MPSDATRSATTSSAAMSAEAFAVLGARRFAYIKPVRSDEVALRYPGAPKLTPGHDVFVLHAADGTPIVFAGSREAALADAASHQLEAVSLH